jgi:hypothetical protein
LIIISLQQKVGLKGSLTAKTEIENIQGVLFKNARVKSPVSMGAT